MKFKKWKLGDAKGHGRWLKRLPEIYRFKGTLEEVEESKKRKKGANSRMKLYGISGYLYDLLIVAFGNRNQLINEMFEFVLANSDRNLTRKDMQKVYSTQLMCSTYVHLRSCFLSSRLG